MDFILWFYITIDGSRFISRHHVHDLSLGLNLQFCYTHIIYEHTIKIEVHSCKHKLKIFIVKITKKKKKTTLKQITYCRVQLNYTYLLPQTV